MRRTIKMLLLVTAVAVVSGPSIVSAEGYINPWAGIIFGNESADKGFKSFGAAVGDTGSKMGIDVNFGYTPDFTGSGGKVVDLMAGVAAGPELGHGIRTVRPTVVGGVGLLRTSSGSVSSNDFGFNIGGGVLAYFTKQLGFRADVRYYRTLNGSDLGEFHFTRLQLGLLIR